jgi:hypothetical protein
LVDHHHAIPFPFNSPYSHQYIPIFAATEYINCRKEASRAAVNIYHVLGYLTGLVFLRPEMEPTTLLRTTALVHFLDAILCRVIAGHGGRRKNLWTAAGLVFGIWALAILFLLPERRQKK